MPKYEVRLGRISRIYERAYVTVDADDEYHAKALALDTGDALLGWMPGDTFDSGDIEVEDCEEVKDDQV